MDILFSVELFAGALFALVVAMIIMLWLQMRSSTQISKLTFPAYEYVIRKAEHDAQAIIEEAQKESRSILAEAEKSGQKIFSQYEESAKSSHDAYVHTLENFTKDLTDQLSNTAKNGMAHLETVSAATLASLESGQEALVAQFDAALSTVEKTSEVLETHTAQAVAQMEDSITKLSDAVALKLQNEDAKHAKLFTDHLHNAEKAAEAQIAEYQRSRTALLDAHIERLVEDVTRRVLNKQLTLDEHAALARQALEEAKSHNLL